MTGRVITQDVIATCDSCGAHYHAYGYEDGLYISDDGKLYMDIDTFRDVSFSRCCGGIGSVLSMPVFDGILILSEVEL
jgi:hypothetical protein